jgi:hypothetical protein
MNHSRILIFGMMLWLGVLTLVIFNDRDHKLNIGVVDTAFLVSEQAKKMASSYPDAKVPSKIMQKKVGDLREAFEAFAQAKHLSLLPKSAVLAGALPDYTKDIVAILEAQESS